MKREIEFRALKDDISNCVFYYGSLIYDKEGNPRIHDVETDLFHTCIKGTECQFTGLTDKDGKYIYEGDICKHPLATAPEENGFLIKWNNSGFIAVNCNYPNYQEYNASDMNHFKKCDVLGNIHQNPELLNEQS